MAVAVAGMAAMAEQPRVWVSRPTFPDIVARLEPYFRVSAEAEERKFSSSELAAKLAGQDAVIVGLKEHIGAAEIAGAKRLRIVANLAVGYDNLDLLALSAAGIAASNTADVLNESVADFTWAMLLGVARRMNAAERWLRAGQWHATEFKGWLGTDVRGRTLGILGGISSGQPVTASIAFKPTSSILIPGHSVNLAGEPQQVVTKGRHDPCVGIRATPIAEAMVALVLMDHALRHRAQCGDVGAVAPRIP
jgi:hypothetical protein